MCKVAWSSWSTDSRRLAAADITRRGGKVRWSGCCRDVTGTRVGAG